MLFLLYVSDIGNCSDTLSVVLFTDDTNLFYSSKIIPILYNVVNAELAKLSEWFCVNRLPINTKKINCFLFGNKPVPPNEANLRLVFGGKSIDQVNDTKLKSSH